MAMTIESFRNVKDRFAEFVDRVDREHERVVGIHSARRGSYRVLHRFDDHGRLVVVMRVEHGGDVDRGR